MTRPLVLSLAAVVAALCVFAATACGSEGFAYPARDGADASSSPTVKPVATVFRTIAVTPAPTPTPTATPVPVDLLPDTLPERDFPNDFNTGIGAPPLPDEVVMGTWRQYLDGARLTIPDLSIDVSLCPDGTIKSESEGNRVAEGFWTLSKSQGRWFEIAVTRQGSGRRGAPVVVLSRSDGRTFTPANIAARVQVTDSETCGS